MCGAPAVRVALTPAAAAAGARPVRRRRSCSAESWAGGGATLAGRASLKIDERRSCSTLAPASLASPRRGRAGACRADACGGTPSDGPISGSGSGWDGGDCFRTGVPSVGTPPLWTDARYICSSDTTNLVGEERPLCERSIDWSSASSIVLPLMAFCSSSQSARHASIGRPHALAIPLLLARRCGFVARLSLGSWEGQPPPSLLRSS